MHISYAEISLPGYRSGRCAKCGGKAERMRRFWQTVNPWNLGPDGKPKTREQIELDLREERIEWERTPLLHKRCEGRGDTLARVLSAADFAALSPSDKGYMVYMYGAREDQPNVPESFEPEKSEREAYESGQCDAAYRCAKWGP